MKKLISLLTISTLTANIPAPLLANTIQTCVKRDVGATFKDVTSGFDIKLKNSKDLNFNWKLIENNNRESEFSEPNNKWYFYIRITDKYICEKVYFDSNFIKNHNTYWQHLKYGINFPVYRWNGTGEPRTPIINPNNGEITDWKNNSLFQKGISFALADGSKTAKWSNAGIRLTVDGETNININNPNVKEVYWDGSLQQQTSKHWKINVKPETTAKDHKLVIKYNINGTKYTSEDIDVVMVAKKEPPSPIVPKQLNELIKNTDLGNLFDNNNDTIFLSVNKVNSNIIDDFSQITIEKKDNHSATLTAKKDSKSYTVSVDVTYNVVPSTTVDLQIELKPTVSSTIVDKNYFAQLNSSKMTNKVDTFYYANSESVITMVKPTPSSVITGKIIGLDKNWNIIVGQEKTIDITSGIKLDGNQLQAYNGRYIIGLVDDLGNSKRIFLQIHNEKYKKAYWNTDNGKQFEQWAKDNGYKNIRGSSTSQLNNLFELSQTWKQSLAHLDLKLDNFVVHNIKNVSQDEIDNYKTKMLASVKSQVEKYIPNVVENTDYVINTNNLVAGDWTVSKDVKVQHVEGSTKILSFAIKTIPVQQKEQATPPTPDNNKKDGDSKLWIIGVVVGVLAGLGLAYWLFKRFIFDKYIYPKIIARRHNKLVEQIKKEEAEKDKQNNKGCE